MDVLVKTVNHGTVAAVSRFDVLSREDDAICVDTRFLMIRTLISLAGTAAEVLCIAMHHEDTMTATRRDDVVVRGLHQAASERMRALALVHIGQLGADTGVHAASLMKVFGGDLPESDETDAAWNERPSSCRTTSSRVAGVLHGLLSCAMSPGSVWTPGVITLWSYLIESVVHVLRRVVASRGLLGECDVLTRILLFTARLWNADPRVPGHLSAIMMTYMDACERTQADEESDSIVHAVSGGWDLLGRLCDKHDLLTRYEREERLCVDRLRTTVSRRIFGVMVSLRVEKMMAFGSSSVASPTSVTKTFAKSFRLLREAGYHGAEVEAEAIRRVSSPSAFFPGDPHFSPCKPDGVEDELDEMLRRKKTAEEEDATWIERENEMRYQDYLCVMNHGGEN